jgi:hypothetical protein
MPNERARDWRWSKRHRCFVAQTDLPGIFCRKTREGQVDGFVVRTRIVDPARGKPQEIKRVMPGATLGEAQVWLENEAKRIREGGPHGEASPMRFGEFAAQLFEEKLAAGDIRSEAGKRKWADVLVHLVDGSRVGSRPRRGDVDRRPLVVVGFGEFFFPQIRAAHIDAWRVAVASKLIAPAHYSPTTCNGWVAILKVVGRAGVRRFDLTSNPFVGMTPFDTSEHLTYTEEQPNSLTADEASALLAKMRVMFPQHFAMTATAMVTGLRPCTLRPLRRTGADADIKWSEKKLLIRRSQTHGERAMNRTKVKGLRQRIHLPDDLIEILQWHVDTQLDDEQRKSELLFPASNGGFRTPSVLNKPLALVAEEIGLGKKFTQRGLRRAFNDLARDASIAALVTRSISGHLTEAMQDHYSTVRPEEQRAAIAKVIDLVSFRRAGDGNNDVPDAAGG